MKITRIEQFALRVETDEGPLGWGEGEAEGSAEPGTVAAADPVAAVHVRTGAGLGVPMRTVRVRYGWHGGGTAQDRSAQAGRSHGRPGRAMLGPAMHRHRRGGVAVGR